jgi:hypothetical protein
MDSGSSKPREMLQGAGAPPLSSQEREGAFLSEIREACRSDTGGRAFLLLSDLPFEA